MVCRGSRRHREREPSLFASLQQDRRDFEADRQFHREQFERRRQPDAHRRLRWCGEPQGEMRVRGLEVACSDREGIAGNGQLRRLMRRDQPHRIDRAVAGTGDRVQTKSGRERGALQLFSIAYLDCGDPIESVAMLAVSISKNVVNCRATTLNESVTLQLSRPMDRPAPDGAHRPG
mgnify:CR=1 FL=1